MDIPRISPHEVAERLDGGERVAFVDARSAHAYEAASEQLPGSIRLSPDDPSPAPELPRDTLIVSYCT